MAIKGSLSEASLADVVQLLSLGMKNGCLSVADRSRLGQIFFDRGRISFARIVNRRDRIGDMLVRAGALTHDQLEEALRGQERTPERRLGELLIEAGTIAQDALDRCIRQQIEEAVYHLFTWTRGTFFFEAGERPEDGETTVSISPDSLLLEAARRVDEWSLIEKKLPSLDVMLVLEQERLEAAAVDLSEEQRRLIPLIDGETTVDELVDRTGLSEFETGKALFGLIQAGFARTVGQREEVDEVAEDLGERRNLAIAFYRAGMLEDASREFHELLELDPRDGTARFHLALIQLRERRFEEAVESLKRLLETGGPRFGAFMNLAFALRASGRPDDAVLTLDAAERQRPDSPLPLLSRAVGLLAQSHLREARRGFEEYRRRTGSGRPLVPWFYFAGLAAALDGDLDQADATVREGLRAHPRAAPLLLLAGLVAERRGDLETAERDYRRALEADPSLPQIHKNLGDLAYRRGAHDEALQCFQRATELAPDLGSDVWVKLGNLHYKARNREGAIRCWTRALDLDPANQTVRNNLEIVSHAVG